MFWLCSGSAKGPASRTRILRLCEASANRRDAAIAAPNVPPPMTMVSKFRVLPATWIALLSSASCNVLQRKRPMLSRVKVVSSDVSIGESPSVQVGRGGRDYSHPDNIKIEALLSGETSAV